MLKKWLIVIVLLVSTSGCSDKQPAIKALSDNAVVLAFGDSLTAGTGVNKENSYPSVLARMIDRMVINAGVPGEVSREGFRRLPGLLDKYQPELVIISHGGNDLIRKLDAEKLVQNISAMIRAARNRGISVILLGIPRPGIFLSSVEFYNKLALDYNIPIENEILADILSDSSLKSDAIHPNIEGYRLMADSIFLLMKQTGAIE
ncbi:MAG TPA: arylesterase [Gammaproteobacteria bacterium]|nr:arylesterase [Gammaproteobacteria bacterium]